jgi:hypothetical protein
VATTTCWGGGSAGTVACVRPARGCVLQVGRGAQWHGWRWRRCGQLSRGLCAAAAAAAAAGERGGRGGGASAGDGRGGGGGPPAREGAAEAREGGGGGRGGAREGCPGERGALHHTHGVRLFPLLCFPFFFLLFARRSFVLYFEVCLFWRRGGSFFVFVPFVSSSRAQIDLTRSFPIACGVASFSFRLSLSWSLAHAFSY